MFYFDCVQLGIYNKYREVLITVIRPFFFVIINSILKKYVLVLIPFKHFKERNTDNRSRAYFVNCSWGRIVALRADVNTNSLWLASSWP